MLTAWIPGAELRSLNAFGQDYDVKDAVTVC